jgi:hypothetical protein
VGLHSDLETVARLREQPTGDEEQQGDRDVEKVEHWFVFTSKVGFAA